MFTLHPVKLIRIRDRYLIKWKCPNCTAGNLTGIDYFCVDCGFDPKPKCIDLNNCEKNNLVAVPDEKRRKTISKRIAKKLYDDQEGKCAYCFKYVNTNYHIDHIVPLSVGGCSNIENLVVSCPQCNLKASNKVFDSFWQKQAYLLSIKNAKQVAKDT